MTDTTPQSATSATVESPPGPPAGSISVRRPWLLGLACGLFVAWCGVLLSLVVKTANPPAVNLAQLAEARLIATVEIVDLDQGRCRILRAWTPDPPAGEIHVTNLDQTIANTGGRYILPLRRDPLEKETAYRVVELPERGIDPLIYPDQEDVRQQIDAWQQPVR